MKEEQFQLYKEIYLVEIHPCLVKEDELRKMAGTISLSADIGLDLDRLETPLSKVKKRVQAIEASLDWANTSLLMSEVKELEAKLQGIFKLLEQGMFRRQKFVFFMIQTDIKLFSLLGLHTIHDFGTSCSFNFYLRTLDKKQLFLIFFTDGTFPKNSSSGVSFSLDLSL